MTGAGLPGAPRPARARVERRTECCERVPLLRVRDLCVRYGNNLALDDVSIDIPRGCLTALVGPSGCGKTTFLTTLNRLTDLVAGCRVEGAIDLDGVAILDPKIDLVGLRRRIGMIFQKPNPLPLSIRKNIAFPLRQHGVRDRDGIAATIESSLRDVGLWDEVKDRLDAPAARLSGGQQQRLCLARAIALAPEVLLLDEPCSALDPLASGRVEDLIASLRSRYTVVVVTHNLAQARRIADDVAFFWTESGAGRLIEHGAARDVFATPRHELTAAYLSGERG